MPDMHLAGRVNNFLYNLFIRRLQNEAGCLDKIEKGKTLTGGAWRNRSGFFSHHCIRATRQNAVCGFYPVIRL